MDKKELSPIEKAARDKMGDKRYTKRPLLGAERKAWLAAKKLSK